jgi:pimeloyl-ACP methyl ester carboxylesterase
MKFLGLLLALTALGGSLPTPSADTGPAGEARQEQEEQEKQGKRGQGKKKGAKKKDGEKGRREGRRVTEQLVLEARDGVKIAVDLYRRNEEPGVPMLVLLHDGSGSRGEYREIAPRLSRMGYNCMAVDLRAGGESDTIRNMTAKTAEQQTRNTTLVHAERDIVAALQHARATYPGSQVVVVGCSYSGALALRLAGTRPELLDGVAAFSPSEYFEAFEKPATWIRDSVGTVACPVFVTSSRGERAEWKPILDAIPSTEKTSFLPKGRGVHGVAALSEGSEAQAYWEALTGFLTTHFPPVGDTGGDTRDASSGHTLDRVVALGASLTNGMWLETDLEAVLAATITHDGAAVRSSSDLMFFTDPFTHAEEQLAFARELQPTLVVALDYLFWFGYGAQNAERRVLGGEEERLALLEVGLGYLDGLDVPLVVGNFPDMSGAVGKMIMATQMPAPETLVLLNARLEAWAEERGDVVVLPLADIVASMQGGEAFEIGRHGWPPGSTRRLLHLDGLHPTLEGLGAIVHLTAVSLVERGFVSEEDVELDLAEVLATFGASFVDAGPVLQTTR